MPCTCVLALLPPLSSKRLWCNNLEHRLYPPKSPWFWSWPRLLKGVYPQAPSLKFFICKMVLRPHKNVGGLSEKVYMPDRNPWINGPQHNFTFVPGIYALLHSLIWQCSLIWKNRLPADWAFAAGKGLHVVKALHFGGWLFRFLVTVTNTWENLHKLGRIGLMVLGSSASCQKGRMEQKCWSCTGTRSDKKWPETRYASKVCPQWPFFLPRP